MKVYTLWPWVGGGTNKNPYRTSFVPLGVQAQARLFLNGFTCFDPDTGLLTPVSGLNAEATEALMTNNTLFSVGSHVVSEIECSAVLYDAFEEFLSSVWVYGTSLDELLLRAEVALDDAVANMVDDASFDPADVVTSAVDAIAACGDAGTVSYYNKIIDPFIATPEVYPNLLIQPSNAKPHVDMDFAAELANPTVNIATADTAWAAIICKEAIPVVEAAL